MKINTCTCKTHGTNIPAAISTSFLGFWSAGFLGSRHDLDEVLTATEAQRTILEDLPYTKPGRTGLYGDSKDVLFFVGLGHIRVWPGFEPHYLRLSLV